MTRTKKPLTERQLNQRHEVNLVHGGAGAVRRIYEGRELIGIAKQAEEEVRAEYEKDGRTAIVKRDAFRLQACADMYFNAVQFASKQGDLECLDHYVDQFARLTDKSLRAWAMLKAEEERPSSPVTVQAVLDAVRNVNNEE